MSIVCILFMSSVLIWQTYPFRAESQQQPSKHAVRLEALQRDGEVQRMVITGTPVITLCKLMKAAALLSFSPSIPPVNLEHRYLLLTYLCAGVIMTPGRCSDKTDNHFSSLYRSVSQPSVCSCPPAQSAPSSLHPGLSPTQERFLVKIILSSCVCTWGPVHCQILTLCFCFILYVGAI